MNKKKSFLFLLSFLFFSSFVVLPLFSQPVEAQEKSVKQKHKKKIKKGVKEEPKEEKKKEEQKVQEIEQKKEVSQEAASTQKKEGSEEKVEESAKEQASDLFFEGVMLFDRGKFASALEKFSKSYELHPHWKTLYNIGMCYLEMNDLPSAGSKLSMFLEGGKGKIQTDLVEEVAKILKDIKSKVGIIKLTGHYEGGILTIDGVENKEGVQGKDVFLTPGVHQVKLVRGKQIFLDRKVTIEAGEEKEIFVLAEPTAITQEEEEKISAEEKAKQEAKKMEEERMRREMEKRSKFKKAGWAIFGISIALIAGGSAAGALALKGKGEVEDLEDEYNSKFNELSQQELDIIKNKRDNKYNEAMAYSIASTVLLSAGGVAILTSLILLPYGYKKLKIEKKVGLFFEPKLNSFGIVCTF